MGFRESSLLLKNLIDAGALWHGDGEQSNCNKIDQGCYSGPQRADTGREGPPAQSASLQSFPSLQSFLQILAHAGLHEFLFDPAQAPVNTIPLLLPTMSLNHICNQKLFNTQQADSPLYIWIGKEAWPSPYILKHSRSLFIDVDSDKNKSWSIFTALKCIAVTGVFAHLNKASFALTRRLSLVAKDNKTRAFLFRDIKNITQKSAAHSRFIISQMPSDQGAPTWRVTLTQIREGWNRGAAEYINDQIPKLAEWIIQMRQDEETVSFNLSAIIPERAGTKTETLALAS
jgi:hypothetical protein